MRVTFSPVLKVCVIVAVFTLSTGVYFRQLFRLTFKDSVAFAKSCFWLASDILPCLATLAVLYNVVITKNDPPKFKGLTSLQNLSPATIVILVNLVLYFLDFIFTSFCYANSSLATTQVVNLKTGATIRQQQVSCELLAARFRYVFFHVQLALNVLYLTKPWTWTRVELSAVMQRVVRASSMLIKTCSSIRKRIDPQVFTPKTPKLKHSRAPTSIVDTPTTSRQPSQPKQVETTTSVVETSTSISQEQEPDQEQNQQQQKQRRRSRIASRGARTSTARRRAAPASKRAKSTASGTSVPRTRARSMCAARGVVHCANPNNLHNIRINIKNTLI